LDAGQDVAGGLGPVERFEGCVGDRMSVPSLFDWLLAEPMRFAIDGGRGNERYLVIIDALDETIREGRS
jgi:hypothetical protein